MSFKTAIGRFFGFTEEPPLRHEIPRGNHSATPGPFTEAADMLFDEHDYGEVFDHRLPHARDLDNTRLRDRVFDYMSTGQWHTLADISFFCNGTEASCSARLRDFRKTQYGEHTVHRRHVGNRLYEYQLIMNSDSPKGRLYS